METNRVPVTYKNGKSEKELVDYNKLWQVAFWGFDTRIGSITNDSTTIYEIQSQFEKNTPEYKELDKRLKLFRYFQGNEIDRAKNGSRPKKLPKYFNTFQKIVDEDTAKDIEKKNFENSLIIEKRPDFMKFLYSKYSKQDKEFNDDFELYCRVVFGKEFKSLTEDDKQTQKYEEMVEYYNKKKPFLETNGVMNRISRYMQDELRHIRPKNNGCDNQKIFGKLYNTDIELDNNNLEKMKVVFEEYRNFKKTKQLKSSEYSSYEQYFKYLREKSLQEISSSLQELANLAVYTCYVLYPSKPKDFCWDVFGAGIVENLKERHQYVLVPTISEFGWIEYLGKKYSLTQVSLTDNADVLEFSDVDESLFDDLDDDLEDANVDI